MGRHEVSWQWAAYGVVEYDSLLFSRKCLLLLYLDYLQTNFQIIWGRNINYGLPKCIAHGSAPPRARAKLE